MKRETLRVCQLCGAKFYSRTNAKNCKACGKGRHAAAAALSLIASGEVITSDGIQEAAAMFDCTVSGVYNALRSRGYSPTSIWLHRHPWRQPEVPNPESLEVQLEFPEPLETPSSDPAPKGELAQLLQLTATLLVRLSDLVSMP